MNRGKDLDNPHKPEEQIIDDYTIDDPVQPGYSQYDGNLQKRQLKQSLDGLSIKPRDAVKEGGDDDALRHGEDGTNVGLRNVPTYYGSVEKKEEDEIEGRRKSRTGGR